MSTIGERIQKARKRAGLSQKELAQISGLANQSAISHYETGRRQPTVSILLMLARALGTTSAALAGTASGEFKGIPILGNEHALNTTSVPATRFLRAISDDKNAFAIRIEGRGFLPRFRPGEMLLVEPTQKPTPGDEVVVVQPGGALRIVEFIRVTKNEMFVRTIIERHDEIIPLADLESSGTVRGIYRSTLIRSED